MNRSLPQVAKGSDNNWITMTIAGDVSDKAHHIALVDGTIALFGCLDILLRKADITARGAIRLS